MNSFFTTTVISFFLLLLSSYAHASTLTASTNKTTISEDEILELSIRINEKIAFGSPDYDKLSENFDILQRRRNDTVSLIGSSGEYTTQWSLAISPKKTGELIIPPFSMRGVTSEAIKITVNPATPAAPGELKDIFIEIETDKKSVYVQEQLVLAVRINTGLVVRDMKTAKELVVDNAVAEMISEVDYNKRLQGKLYRIKEIKYVIFPQKSGPLIIPSVTWNLTVATTRSSRINSAFRTPGILRVLRSKEKTIDVKPKPSAFTGTEWMPAEEVSIEQHWNTSTRNLVVGEPITRTITVKARGLSAAQIPPFPEQLVSGIKMYSDQPQFENSRTNTGIQGTRIESLALVPSKSGTIILPEVNIVWWDTTKNYQRVATLAKQVLTIAPSATNTVDLPPLPGETPVNDGSSLTTKTGAEEDQQAAIGFSMKASWPWIASNILFASLALLFFIAWQRKTPSANENEDTVTQDKNKKINESFHGIRKACSDQDPLAARAALGQWGGQYWDMGRNISLSEIGQRSGSSTLTKALEEMDEILYGKQKSDAKTWDGDLLWQILVAFKKHNKDNNRQEKNAQKPLPPLYPESP